MNGKEYIAKKGLYSFSDTMLKNKITEHVKSLHAYTVEKGYKDAHCQAFISWSQILLNLQPELKQEHTLELVK